MTNRALFIGGPGTLSTSAIQALQKRGYTIAVFSHPRLFNELDVEVKGIAGDRDDPLDLKQAIKNFKPDVILDFVLFTPEQAHSTYSLVKDRVRQYIFISTVDVYGYPLSHLPFREDDPWNPQTQSAYAADKRLSEQYFRERSNSNHFPLTIARPAYSFGKRFILSFMSRDKGTAMLRRLRESLPVMVPGDGTTLMHVSSAKNSGEMIAALVDAPAAIGKDYTVGHPYSITHDEYVNLFGRALNVEPKIVHVPTDFITGIDRPEIKDCLLHALTRYNISFSIDRFLRDFPEFQWSVTLDEWARQVVQWNIQQKTLDSADKKIIDDEIIEAWEGSAKHLTRLLSTRQSYVKEEIIS